MLFLWQHPRYTTSFEAGEALHLCVPSGDSAFELRSGRNVMFFLRGERRSIVAAGIGGDMDMAGLQFAPFLRIIFGDLAHTGMVQESHD